MTLTTKLERTLLYIPEYLPSEVLDPLPVGQLPRSPCKQTDPVAPSYGGGVSRKVYGASGMRNAFTSD